MDDHRDEFVSATEFIDQSRFMSGILLQGFVSYDPQRQDSILFGRNPDRCPTLAIPKDCIAGLQLGARQLCRSDPNGPVRWMQRAIVYLKRSDSPSPAEALFEGLLGEMVQPDDERSCERSSAGLEVGYEAYCNIHGWKSRCYTQNGPERNKYNAQRAAINHNNNKHDGREVAHVYLC